MEKKIKLHRDRCPRKVAIGSTTDKIQLKYYVLLMIIKHRAFLWELSHTDCLWSQTQRDNVDD